MKQAIIFALLVAAFNFSSGAVVCNEGSCICSTGRTLTQTRNATTNGLKINEFCLHYFKGCGPKGINFDSPSSWDFETACDTHDFCYSTCGTSRSSCDRAFCSDLADRCDALSFGEDLLCFTFANIGCSFVRSAGGPFFIGAQRNSCDCS